MPRGKLSRWVHNVAEDDDFDAWSLLQSKLSQAGLVGMKLFANAAAGGIILFSRWAASPLSQGLWPAPGLLCELTEPNGTHMPQLSDVGMLTPISAEHAPLGFALGLTEAAIGRIVVARVGVGYTWVTNLGSHWEGKLLPESQIEKLLADEFPRTARAAVLVVLPALQSSARERVQLIVFARPHSEEKLSASAVSEYLREALGHDWVPRDVRVFEVNPRLEDPHDPNGAIDRPACVAQYLSGTIWLKHRCGPVFRELARLSGQI